MLFRFCFSKRLENFCPLPESFFRIRFSKRLEFLLPAPQLLPDSFFQTFGKIECKFFHISAHFFFCIEAWKFFCYYFPGVFKRYGGKDMGKHLTELERYRIEYMLKDGFTPCQIADKLGKCFSAIYKEIKKGTVTLLNSDLTTREEYCADAAQRITDERKRNKGRDLKIGSDHELAGHIEYLIGTLHYSPYAAVQDIRKRGTFKTDICEVTLYKYIDMGLFLNISNKDLYSKRNKRKQVHHEVVRRPAYTKLKGKSIEERPQSVKNRDDYGHWEMDTVYSGKDTSKECLLVLTERMARDEYLFKMPDRTLQSTVDALDCLERALGYDEFCRRFKTITVDNGSEFGDSSAVEKSCIYPDRNRTALFFCHPGSSCERGSNENANKLVRHWIPKGDDISRYDDGYIQFIQDWMNDYPRKLFGGLSANEYKAALGIC